MTKRLVLLLAVCLAMTAPVSAAEGRARASGVSGDVTVFSGSSPSRRLASGDAVVAGDEIRAAANSKCSLVLEGKPSSAVKIEPSSTVRVSSLDPVRLDVRGGKLFALVNGLAKGSTFEVSTPTAIASVRGTALGAETGAAGDRFYAFENSIEVTPQGGVPAVLEEGFGASVGGGALETFQLGDADREYFRESAREAEEAMKEVPKAAGEEAARSLLVFEDDPMPSDLSTGADAMPNAKEETREVGAAEAFKKNDSGGTGTGGQGGTSPGGGGDI